MPKEDSITARKQIQGASPEPSSGSATPAHLPQSESEIIPIRGGNMRIVENMESSLAVPTATSYRTIPVKLLVENRRIINDYRESGGRRKVSFTHILAWALVRALQRFPALNASYRVMQGNAYKVLHRPVHLGIAVDLARKDGSRTLLVPNIKNAHHLTFDAFIREYDEAIRKVRTGTVTPSDMEGTTISLTNPGTVGTSASLPRLVEGQGAIVAAGSVGYPPEYHAWSSHALSSLGLSKVVTVSCTYDHRIIQGAESGEFLGKIHDLLLGKEEFYEEIFRALKLPAVPIQWSLDHNPALLAPTRHDDLEKQVGVLKLINMYRVRGHLIADLDPLGDHSLHHPELDPDHYSLTVWDLDREFVTGGLGSIERGSLREILAVLRQTYCQKIGVEYRHIQDPEEKVWIQNRLEPAPNRIPLDPETRLEALKLLVDAEGLEKYLHTRFIGHKRFGLEGAETTIPVLARILSDASNEGVQEAVIGMAHRGRLNVLANIIGKPLAKILSEFEENTDPMATQGSGDVKYHLGSAGTFRSREGNEILVTVGPNPSHLEWVNPVIEGIVRAKQARRRDLAREQVIPILVHGDAAFAGQGIVWETINLSQLYGYRTGGTIHVVINNQIGFTTTPEEARSSPYPTDLARSIQAPILHVNGDDPDSAVRVARLAFAYRQRYKKDVVIDIFCYRRHGHNEGDEPSYTQPLLYKKIAEHPSVVALYSQRLMREGTITQADFDAMKEETSSHLEKGFSDSQKGDQIFKPDIPLAVSEEELREFQPTGGTRVGMEMLMEVAARLTSLPKGFRLHPKLKPLLARRQELIAGNTEIDWAYAEALAFGTLVYEGTPVRLSGQDSARGTFSQRHLILADLETDEKYVPLQHVHPNQAEFEVFDSSLSEAAVLGFEFGYSVADPLSLVLWEAQFGDFANAAQAVIDNFIASSEAKWLQPCDLVLLLPHGYEGQGPEHSSARIERFLNLCAEENMRVCLPSNPSQYFHLLRLQMRDAKRIPMVIMTPKSTLRHPRAVSSPNDLAEGSFQPVLDDPDIKNRDDARKVLICSGKVYYDLLLERERRKSLDIAIIRLEQFYPYPEWHVSNALSSFARAREICWVQEEPKNMGAWSFLRTRIVQSLPLGRPLNIVSRPESASPATGSLKIHRKEQAVLVQAAFA